MKSSERYALALAAFDGLMAVLGGAFGAHGAATPGARELLRTGAEYQLVHAAAGVAVAALRLKGGGLALWLFGVGGLLFGGSLDLLAETGARAIGVVTPVGGLLLILGWAVLLFRLLSEGRQTH